MNTPAHIAASVFVWRKEVGWAPATAVALGAMLPDLPMFGFHAYQKASGRPEREIWSTLYFDESWQLFFDIFNAIPLAVVLIFVCRYLGFRWGAICAASALLHMLCDLPLHNDDAHRHFLPLSHWRWESPFSYWDPRHYGRFFMWLELVLAVGACLFVGFGGKSFPMRLLALGTLSLYGLAITFAIVMWGMLSG